MSDRLISIQAFKELQSRAERAEASLVESDRIITADADQIFKLGEKMKRFRIALKEIIQSEEDQSIRSFGLGDIARKALAETEGK